MNKPSYFYIYSWDTIFKRFPLGITIKLNEIRICN